MIASAVNCARLVAPVFALKFREWKRTVTSVTPIALAMKAVERPSMRCSRHSRSRPEISGGARGTLWRGPRPIRASPDRTRRPREPQSEAFLGAARVLAANESDHAELVVGGALRDDVAAEDAERLAGIEHLQRGMASGNYARNSPTSTGVPQFAAQMGTGSMRRNLSRM